MPIDVAGLTDAKLATLIKNHQDKRAFDATYRFAVEERARRGTVSFDACRSMDLIRAAARDRRFISYLEICEGNGGDWTKLRYQVFRHLDHLLDVAHVQGAPLVTAIVVAKDHLLDGRMDERTRTGFLEAARRLGFTVSDEAAFVEEQQQATFNWAAGRT